MFDSKTQRMLSSLFDMSSHLAYDVDSAGRRSWSFPTSCSPGSVSVSGDQDESLSGRTFPSTGTIPILLFDDDADDLLGGCDPASFPPQIGVTDNIRSERTGSNTGHRVVKDSSDHVLLGLGTRGISSVCGSSGEQSATGGGGEGGVRRLVRLAFDSRDSELSSGSGDGREDDGGREKDDSLFLVDAGSPPSHPRRCCCCCCPPPSCSGRPSQAGSLPTPGAHGALRNCCGSCGASPAAISKTHRIAAAKEHKQDFVALETFDPRTGQPSSNSITLCDCVARPPFPLPLDHDHDHDHHEHDIPSRQRDTSTCTLSSAEADLSIKFPPRDRTMYRGLPPPCFPIEPSSSSSSSSSLNLPHHLAWLRNVTISLCIDQESFRAVFPTFKLVGYTKPTLPIHSSRAGMQRLLVGSDNGNPGGTSIKQLSELMDRASTDPDLLGNLDVGMAEFMPLKRESFLFHHSSLDTPPLIRRLTVNGDESRDYLSQHARLSIKSTSGFQVYAVSGSEIRRGSGGEEGAGRSDGGIGTCPIRLEWQFEYTVEDKRKADGTRAGGGEKILTPLRFSCSPGLLHSRQGRKVTVLNVWKKSIQPKLVAGKVEIPSTTSPTKPRTHDLTEIASPPTSPKSPLRFPTTGRLWGRRTKPSPYQFDKGSDGSEECLIPSDDPGSRRRRPRPSSTYISRISHEAERPPQRWGGDRGQSADACRSTNRDAWSPIAGAERSRARSKTQSAGRGATSEDEKEGLSSRSQGGHSTARLVYSRRPRTAR